MANLRLRSFNRILAASHQKPLNTNEWICLWKVRPVIKDLQNRSNVQLSVTNDKCTTQKYTWSLLLMPIFQFSPSKVLKCSANLGDPLHLGIDTRDQWTFSLHLIAATCIWKWNVSRIKVRILQMSSDYRTYWYSTVLARHIQSRDTFRQIACERKYLVDWNLKCQLAPDYLS